MALSTRAKLAGLGGALALGVLGATGVAYASGDATGPAYVTTVDEGTARYGTTQQERAPADREDCPEKDGGSGRGGQGSPQSPAPQESAPADPADA